MPFLMQPSPFPGLGLAPPMAPIMVEARDLNKMNPINKIFNKTNRTYFETK
jgi:hypothetical protein